MNSLSWLLYVADVANKLSGFFFFFGFILIAACVVCIIASFGIDSDVDNCGDKALEQKEKERRYARNARRLAFAGIALAFTFWTLSAIVPSKSTVYAIAASEMGENVLQSETGTLAQQALNAWLQKQIQSVNETQNE